LRKLIVNVIVNNFNNIHTVLNAFYVITLSLIAFNSMFIKIL